MAAFGAKYIKYAVIKTEEENKLPAYDAQKTKMIGSLVKADLTVNFASGELYADDLLAEKAEEFISGNIAVEVDELDDEVASVIYGATVNEQNEKVDNTGDNAPYGGLGYIKTLMKKGTKYYRAYYYPKVRAALGNDNTATKSSSITFSTTPVNFTVYEPKTGDWRYTKKFDTEAEAKAWIDSKLSSAGV